MSDTATVVGATEALVIAPEIERPEEWLCELQSEVEAHPAVNHLLLSRLATVPFTRSDYKSFGLQHHALVGFFTRYMEILLVRAPRSDQKLWLAKVLVDEYGEGSDGDDHAELYRQFLVSTGMVAGEENETELCPEVWDFVREHLRLTREEPFLVGLGALGPATSGRSRRCSRTSFRDFVAPVSATPRSTTSCSTANRISITARG